MRDPAPPPADGRAGGENARHARHHGLRLTSFIPPAKRHSAARGVWTIQSRVVVGGAGVPSLLPVRRRSRSPIDTAGRE
jgi:hypothetical protein